MRRRKRLQVVIFVSAFLVGSLVPSAVAGLQHFQWTNADGSDILRIDPSRLPPFETLDFNAPIIAAAAEFNSVVGSSFEFLIWQSPPAIGNCRTYSCAGVLSNQTWIGDYWTSTCVQTECWNFTGPTTCQIANACLLGVVSALCDSGCVWGDNLRRAWVIVNHDDDISWNLSGGAASNQYDLQAVVTHELGHVAGFTHINVSCGTSLMYTMCGSGFLGQIAPRTLRDHEEADLATKY